MAKRSYTLQSSPLYRYSGTLNNYQAHMYMAFYLVDFGTTIVMSSCKPCQTIMIKRLDCGHPPRPVGRPSGLNVFLPLVFHSRHSSLTHPGLTHVRLSMSSHSPPPSCLLGFPFISQHASRCPRILSNRFPAGPMHSPRMMPG